MAKSFSVKNPFDGSLVASLELDSDKAIEDALQRASRRAQSKALDWPIHQRLELLQRTHEILKLERDSLIQTALQEGGKPYQDSAVEIDRALHGIQIAIHELSHFEGTVIPMGLTKASEGRQAFTVRQPRGPVLSISAFNHPLNLAVHQIIPAVAVGCPVLFKPSLRTPLSGLHLIKALWKAGAPEDLVQQVLCTNEQAERLAKDPRFAVLNFIGSAKVGWKLRSQLAPGVICTLEHGGVAPVILDKSADLDEAVPALVKAGFYHAGQVCVSVQRVFVHEDRLNDFVDSFQEKVLQLKVGDPADKETDVGPLIQKSEVERVHAWVSEAQDAGAKVLCGGEPIGATCYAPSLLLNPPMTARVSKEEVFGPVVCIYPFRDLEEAIQEANAVDYAFQSSVFTQDIDRALGVAERLDASAVMINDHSAFRVDWMPFGGLKASGCGLGGIGPSMRELSFEKMIVIRKSYKF